ncbi:ATP-binding cassette domain-containing protein [Luteipulveratus halotolerans]|uniref:ABC transporter domain-containing protein n=1 Tax=Luteipulveratus halotolerans TaxID=1631356 RepID=A0A0L6CDM3_9MICO|nr:ATP-binding cassette domain-containing protein [Luteipulveratus halotolerans]KNX35917.1 hypothetical protein VV01_21925 [Luteipulveratus halotolerans]
MVSISLSEVGIRLRRRDVLRGVTWHLPETGKTLLAGQNGVGKTTTLRVLSGALSPADGAVLVDGRPIRRRQLRSVVALMPQTITAIPGLSVIDQVAFAGWLGGLRESAARAQALAVLDQVDLVEEKDRNASQLSGGQLRRVGLAEALTRPSDMLLLDEPTAGLDPVQRARFRELVDTIDKPLVLSTHQLDDVDQTFSNVVVLSAGNLAFEGSTQEFLSHGAGDETSRRAESAFVALTGAAS